MDIYWYVMMFVLGTLIGSFLNVVIYRLHTGRSVNGRSHCMSCGEGLKWFELFPIFSYLFLRARCRYCSSYIPSRYLTVEVLTGVVFLGIFMLFGVHIPSLVFYATLAALLVVIILYDIRHTIIPDELTFLLLVLAGIYVLFFRGGDLSVLSIFQSVLAGLGAGGFFYALWLYSKGRWIGLGDAKLAVPLGMIAGTTGVISMVVLSFWTGAVISVALLGIKWLLAAGTTALRFPLPRLTIHSEVPFAPFLILGFLLAHIFHADIFLISSYLVPFIGL